MKKIAIDIPIEILIKDYLELNSSYKVAKRYNISATAVKRLLKEARVLRTQSDAASMRNKENPIKKVWILEGKAFVEKPIELGITDKIFFEVITGLTGDEEVVIDVEETDVMKEMFARLFGGGLKKE